jgi:hypothetical protein
MKAWSVRLCYSGYVCREVEAEDEDEACDKALKLVGPCEDIADWERWPEADQVEEVGSVDD